VATDQCHVIFFLVAGIENEAVGGHLHGRGSFRRTVGAKKAILPALIIFCLPIGASLPACLDTSGNSRLGGTREKTYPSRCSPRNTLQLFNPAHLQADD